MGPNGMTVAESNEDIIKEQIPDSGAAPAPAAAPSATDDDDDDTDDEETSGTLGGYSTADILAAVSDSAEEGIALLSNWFGLGTPAAAAATPPAPTFEAAAETTDAPSGDVEEAATEASA